MKIPKFNFLKTLIFLLVFGFTFVLRTHNYERVPTSNHLDEMLYAWSGIHLIETGVPVSWSTLDYPKRAEVFKGKIDYLGGSPEASVTLYKPWLDEPPVFALIVGYFAHINGADRNQFIPSTYIRIPVVFMGTLTSIMIFLIARFVSGYWTGILSMLVYGTVPLIVFASRTAMPENFIALLFTIIIFLLLKFHKNTKFWYLVPIPLLIGLAGLSKPTGFFLLPFALYMTFAGLFKEGKWKVTLKPIAYLVLATLPFIGIFFWYGLHFDPEIFWNITGIQSHRPVGFGSLGWFFMSPAFDTSFLKDSWYIFCLLSAAFFIFLPKEGNKRFISFSFVYWIIIVMISGGEGDLLPWYRFPAFPMLAILGAWGIQYVVKNPNFFTTFLVAGMLLGNRLLLVNAFRPNIDPMSYRWLFTALMLPSVALSVFDNKKLKSICRLIIIAVITVGIYFNSIYIYNAFEIKCENLTCPFVPSSDLSTIHIPFFWRFFVLGEPTYK